MIFTSIVQKDTLAVTEVVSLFNKFSRVAISGYNGVLDIIQTKTEKFIIKTKTLIHTCNTLEEVSQFLGSSQDIDYLFHSIGFFVLETEDSN